MTLQEYVATPETVPPQELIFGAMRVADAPCVSHQRVVLKLAVALQKHADAHDGGEVVVAPVDVILDADRALVLQPDLAEYGVREVWLYHQFARRLDVLACEAGVVAATNSFNSHAPIRSQVLPHFGESMAAVLAGAF